MSQDKYLIIDLETTGLDPWRDEILMVGVDDGITYTCCRSKQEFQKLMQKYQEWDIGGHNFTFDRRFLIVKGWQ